jgi:hypothetical protein
MESRRWTETTPATGSQRVPRPNPAGVPDMSRGASAATTPGDAPQDKVHPEGGARNHGSPGPVRPTLTDRRERSCP